VLNLQNPLVRFAVHWYYKQTNYTQKSTSQFCKHVKTQKQDTVTVFHE